ncbi:MAG: DNA-binding protein [Bacteroidales bacterium]
MIISFNQLRRLKDSLPDGSMHKIAKEMGVTVETVRNYFGGENYQEGKLLGIHIEKGPDGGIVMLEDSGIYNKAMQIKMETESAGV